MGSLTYFVAIIQIKSRRLRRDDRVRIKCTILLHARGALAVHALVILSRKRGEEERERKREVGGRFWHRDSRSKVIFD